MSLIGGKGGLPLRLQRVDTWSPRSHVSNLTPSGCSTIPHFRELSCQLHNKSLLPSFWFFWQRLRVLYKALLAFLLFSHACRYFCGSVFKQRTNPNVVGITMSEKLFSCFFKHRKSDVKNVSLSRQSYCVIYIRETWNNPWDRPLSLR